MCEMLLILFNLHVVWGNEYGPAYCMEGLMVSLFKRGNRKNPRNYRGITLLNVVGKVHTCSRGISNHLLKYLELMEGRF